MIDTNTTLDELLYTRGTDEVVRSLQVHLGYDSKIHLPDIESFICDDYYLGRTTNGGKAVFPYWMELLKEIFPNPLYSNYDTVFNRSAIGTGKSTFARILVLYNMLKMILMSDPHTFYGLMPNKELVVFLYALQKSTLHNAMLSPLIEQIDSSQFFKSHRDFSRKGYHFRNKVSINTGVNIASNIGRDIFCSWLDEIQAERFKGQTINNYNSLRARIKSRFMLDDGLFYNSMLILTGSSGSSNDIADRLTIKAESDTRALVNSARQWEVLKDKIKYSGDTFKCFIGNDANEPKVLTDPTEIEVYKRMLGEDLEHEIIDVPIEYLTDFSDNLPIALRDIASASTRSVHSFITNVEKLKHSFCLSSRFFNIDVLKLPFFDDTQIQDFLINPKNSIRDRLLNPDFPRFIHIDIGVTSDLTGIAMTHVAGFTENRNYNQITKLATITNEPWFINDFNVGVSRNKSEETSITKLSRFIIYLRDSGVNIHSVTLDGYQSTQLKQDLLFHQINCEIMSVTKNSNAFDVFKRACYSDRIQLPKNTIAQQEFLQFKKVILPNGKMKVTHPGTNSNNSSTNSHGDIAESICGSVYNAYRNSKNGLDPLAGISIANFKIKEQLAIHDQMDEDELALLLS